jgi:AcrR family transcriptional regulator
VSTSLPESRRKILEAALHLAETKGADALRMEDVAKAAGLSRQAVYLHFASRTGLFVALVEHVDASRGLARESKRLASARTPGEAMKAALELQAIHYPRIYKLAMAIEAARYSDEAAAAAWDDRAELRRAQIRAGIDRLASAGSLAPGWTVDDAVDLVWALTSMKVWESLVVERKWSKARYVKHLHRVLVQAVVAS